MFHVIKKMMALIFDPEIFNSLIQMLNKTMFCFTYLERPRIVLQNLAANVKLRLINGCICQSSQYNVVTFTIKILTLTITISFFFYYCLIFPCISVGYMLVSN